MYDNINSVRVPLVLGDSLGLLQDFLMKPFVDRGNLSAQELQFNNPPSITRLVVDNGYGILKEDFLRLQRD